MVGTIMAGLSRKHQRDGQELLQRVKSELRASPSLDPAEREWIEFLVEHFHEDCARRSWVNGGRLGHYDELAYSRALTNAVLSHLDDPALRREFDRRRR